MEIGFWFFMLFGELMIPVTMIFFGKRFLELAPKNINLWYGYRTKRSMKNRETWIFAHQYIGKLWLRLGWVTLIVSLVPMVLLYGKDIATVGNVGFVLVFLQLIPLVAPIIPTERALKRNFDQYGRRKAV